MERIMKRREMNEMLQNKTQPAPPMNGVDKRVKDLRFRVLSGPGGFYIYDYRLLDAVKKEGKFFISASLDEAYNFLKTFPIETLKERRLIKTSRLNERRIR